jgi:hypothetical protein
MKKLELVICEKVDGVNPIAESYKDFAIIVLKTVDPKAPMDLEKMGERLDVLKKIKSIPHGGIVELENEEFKILNNCAQTMPWGIVDEDAYNFLSVLKKTSEQKD